MNKYEIRDYFPEDSEEVYSLILTIMETEYSDLPANLYLDDIGNIHTSYSGEGNRFLVCDFENKIVGTAGVKKDDESTALMRRFFIHPEHRGKGVSKKLFQEIIEFCKEQKYKQIRFSGNYSMQYIKDTLVKHGFKEEEDIMIGGAEIFKLIYKIK